MATESKTFCEKGMMSTCAQRKDHKEQKTCGYYEKATHFNRCMYLTFKRYCTSIDAQRNTKNI